MGLKAPFVGPTVFAGTAYADLLAAGAAQVIACNHTASLEQDRITALIASALKPRSSVGPS